MRLNLPGVTRGETMPKLAICAKLISVAIVTMLALNQTAKAGQALDRIMSEKLIRLGVRTDTPPFAFVNGERPVGFSVDLCGLVAGAILATSKIDTLDGKFISVQTDERFDALQSGKIDVLCGATTANLKRREIVSFSIPTFSTGIGAVVSRDAPNLQKEVLVTGGPAALSKAAVSEALGGKTIGVRADTTASEWLANGSLASIEGIKVQEVDDHAQGIDAVADGSMTAYFADKAILMGLLMNSDKRDNLEVSQVTFTNEPYALALPRGDEDLRLVIDRALSYLYRKGAIFQVYARHFGKPNAEAVLFYNLVALPE
jgi:ABC-type amino acid transport substrate-binding protein